MSETIPTVVVFTIFFVLAVITFSALLEVWADQTEGLEALNRRQEERLNTAITINSAGPTATDLDCDHFTASVLNSGETPIIDLSKSDLLVEYTDSTDAKVASLLTHVTSAVTGNRWTTTAFTEDTRDPNSWDPQETGTFNFSIDPAMKSSETGPVLIGSPTGVTDSEYFECPEFMYFHSETVSIAATDYYQLKTDVTAEGTATTVSSPFSTGLTGRVSPTTNDGKSTFLLTDSAIIPASTWTATYRAKRDKADFGFVWLTPSAPDITPGTAGSWQDIPLSAHIEAGITATGAVVEVVNTGTTSTYSGVVRGKDDTTDYMSNAAFEEVYASSHRYQMVKLDSSHEMQGFIEHADIAFKLLGYTIGADPEYFTVPPDITPGTTAAWTAVDVSAHVDSDADGVILFIDSVDSAVRNYRIRELTSTDTTDRNVGIYGNTMYLVGIDASDQFEAYIENANINIYLVGQTKGSVVYYTDDVTVSDPAVGSWQALDADTDPASAVSSDAVGLVLWAENSDVSNDYQIGFREGDSTDSWNSDLERDNHFQAAVGITSDNIWDENMENASVNVSVAGYTRLVRMDAHADIDILIRDEDGAVRTTLATDVAESSNITSDSWETVTATYSISEYTVVEATDYLEIDLYAEATLNNSGESVSVDFRLDDSTLDAADQTRIALR